MTIPIIIAVYVNLSVFLYKRACVLVSHLLPSAINQRCILHVPWNEQNKSVAVCPKPESLSSNGTRPIRTL